MTKKHVGLGLALALCCALAWALPTTQQVEAEVRLGHYDRAQEMMKEVVAARPGSARAHYVYAELLARGRQFTQAADEVRLARQIDPALGFTEPEKFRAFEQLLQREQSSAAAPRATAPAQTALPTARTAAPPSREDVRPTAAAPAAGMPGWIWGIGAVVLGWLAWRAFSGRRNAAAGGAAAGMAGPAAASAMPPGGVTPNPAAPYGAAPGYGPAAPGMRPGGGLLGTGVAVAGGIAGGMLIDQMLHRHSDNAGSAGGAGPGNALEPGSFDPGRGGAGGNALEDRPVDFGSGGDDWSSGDGSIDVGGGGGGGGDDWT